MADFESRKEVLCSQQRLVSVYWCCCLLLVMQPLSANGQAEGIPIPLSSEDIQELVDGHNLFRRMVAPPASNMQAVVSIISS